MNATEKLFDPLAAAKAALAKADAKIAKRDKRMKAKGYTHKITAWIHPPTGSDYCIDHYIQRKPTKAEIAKLLIKSEIKDDFAVFEL